MVLDRYEDAVGEDRFFVVVERQQEVYGSGFVKGSFASGFNYGLLRGAVLFAFDWEPPAPVVFVASAREWKAGMGVPAEKEGARLLATSLFGGDGFWPRKKDEGMAEAALLAAWRGKFLAQRLWGIGR
ncbi:MAG: hypothetical protein OXC91_07260 [Rhodobacteraceae bacterium]|nr:hypothetical protein [Paracoccaceae bacterium]